MRLMLYQDIDLTLSRERLDKDPCWVDLQSGVTIVWTPNGDPVRQIAPRSRLPVGRYNSRKAGRLLHHRSRGHGYVGGEKLALMLCEITPAVIDFRSQHIRFDLLIGGRSVTYFPEITALLHDGRIVVIDVERPPCLRQATARSQTIDAVRGICTDLGWQFVTWADEYVAPTKRVRDNIVQIQMQRFLAIDEIQIATLKRAFQCNDGRLTIGDIRQTLGRLLGAGDFVRGLMCRGILELPLREIIQDATIVTAFTRCATPRLEHAG